MTGKASLTTRGGVDGSIPSSTTLMRGGAVVARQSHKLKVVGSSPTHRNKMGESHSGNCK